MEDYDYIELLRAVGPAGAAAAVAQISDGKHAYVLDRNVTKLRAVREEVEHRLELAIGSVVPPSRRLAKSDGEAIS